MSEAKSKMVTIRLSGEEYRILYSRAVRRGENLSDYLRWVLLRKHRDKGLDEEKDTAPVL